MTASPEPDDSAVTIARTAANELIARLREAERVANGWIDEAKSLPLVADALDACLARLAATNCQGPSNQLPSSELWRVAGEWLEKGPLQLHARTKPRGYAGDFELLSKICENQVSSDPLGRAFDIYFQDRTAPRAVRNRTELFASAMSAVVRGESDSPCHWISVGSGPAEDVRRALERIPPEERRKVRVTLLDLDPNALDFSRRRLSPLIDASRLDCVRENLFRLARLDRFGPLLAGADFIGCAGLFDYLADDDASELLAAFWSHLAPRGRLMICNFVPEHPSQSYMEWIGNWYLVYRTAEQLERLADQAGMSPDDVTIGSEETETDLVLSAEKAG